MFYSVTVTSLLVLFPAPRDRDTHDKGPGYLGIAFEANDGPGIRITEIRPKGPAELSGLLVNDVLVKFNGETIDSDTNAFVLKIVRLRPGTTVPVELRRGDMTMTLKVRIGARPEDFPYPLPQREPVPEPIRLPDHK